MLKRFWNVHWAVLHVMENMVGIWLSNFWVYYNLVRTCVMPPSGPAEVLSEIRSKMWKGWQKQKSDVDDGVCGSCVDDGDNENRQ